jgi:hypothetical protein
MGAVAAATGRSTADTGVGRAGVRVDGLEAWTTVAEAAATVVTINPVVAINVNRRGR